jgi:hypothetical protein
MIPSTQAIEREAQRLLQDNHFMFDPQPSVAEEEAAEPEEGRLQLPLRDFIRQAWEVVEPATVFLNNWHIDAIADHLEAVTYGQIRRLIINIPPRCMKSLAVSVFWPAWSWTLDPDPDEVDHGRSVRPGTWAGPGTRFLFSSYAHALSIRDSVKCRRVILSPWYQSHWGGRLRLTYDQNQKIRFDNDRGGYRLSTSVDGALTGEGGDI